jgi:hypothetical protein
MTSRLKWICLICFLLFVFSISLIFRSAVEQADKEYWSPEGGFGIHAVGLLFAPLFCATVLAIPVGALMLLFQKTRRSKRIRWISLFLLSGGLMFYTPLFLLPNPSESPLDKALADLGNRFAPVIQSIEQFKKDSGQYPKSLQDLIPKYLKEIPSTNLGNFPECWYLTGEEARYCQGNPWVLAIHNHEDKHIMTIFYCPLQNYRAFTFKGGEVVPWGEWGYVRGYD